MEENTTLTAKPALVISLKSTASCLKENVVAVAFILNFKLVQRYFIENDLTKKY
jgi:hypothetical protein